MAIFLLTLSHNIQNRVVKCRIDHSLQTIHFYFHEVLWVMLKLSTEMIVQPLYNQNLSVVQHHHGLMDIFKGAVGLLMELLYMLWYQLINKFHIKRRTWRLLLECAYLVRLWYDLYFCVARWEDVAHDSRVLNEIMSDPANNFPFPPADKCYLCDVAYTHTRFFMKPYHNVRNWMAAFQSGGRSRTKKELLFMHMLAWEMWACFWVTKSLIPNLEMNDTIHVLNSERYCCFMCSYTQLSSENNSYRFLFWTIWTWGCFTRKPTDGYWELVDGRSDGITRVMAIWSKLYD